MADEAKVTAAFVDWANAFDASRHVQTITDLCDGQVLFEILAGVDSKYFKNPRTSQITSSDNWVLKYNAIKRLYSLVSHYFEDHLGQSIPEAREPNLQAIAKDGDSNETTKLCQIILALAVQCENNQFYIGKIQGLGEQVQHALMLSIEQVMGDLDGPAQAEMPSDEDEQRDNSEESINAAESSTLRRDYETLLRQHHAALEKQKQVQATHEDLIAERDELKLRVDDVERNLEANQAGKADVFFKGEIDNLRAQLTASETILNEKERTIERQSRNLDEVNKKVEELSLKAEEASRLKDQVDEYKHAADRLQKTENVIEKYKKKLEESADLRRQLKGLEDQNAGLMAKNSHLEEEYQKLMAFKSLMDSYKSQIAHLEESNSELAKQKNKVEYDAKNLVAQNELLETERKRDLEQMSLLEDKVRELELGGRRGLNKELGDEDQDDVGGDLDDALSGTTMTDLKLKIAKLERELTRVRDEKTDGAASKVVVLQNLLEDANRAKAKFEADFLQAHQDKLVLENELNRVRQGKPDIGDGPEMSLSLRKRLNEYEQELSVLKLQHSELTIKYEQTEKELVVAKSDLNLVGKDRLDALATLKANNVSDAQRMEAALEAKTTKIAELEEERSLQMQQLNKVLLEKDALQSQTIQDRDQLLEKERINSELKESLAALGSANDETLRTQNVQMQERNMQLQEHISQMQVKMQKAKEFIKQQDAILKAGKSKQVNEGTEEMFAKLKEEMTRKDQEIGTLKKQVADTKLQARREQQLIISAWHSIGSRIQRDNVAGQRASAAPPASWLGQQRRTLDSQLKRR